MILKLSEARDILRLDGTENDEIIIPLIEAIPPYLEAATGFTPRSGELGPASRWSPVARTAARFILQLWYYGENSDTAKLERVIDCLLKALSAERTI
jgi:hypothetical protein